jgi:DNA-binding transcriptional regulator YiaG
MFRLEALGLVDKTTMRELDESSLTQIEEFSPEAVRALRG